MLAPPFWQKDGLLPRLLAPLGWIYAATTARRLQRPGVRVPAVVICCGNATAGGTGKTILALALADLLISQGHSPAFISRGYGGALKGPLRVDPRIHSARDVGDEPLLLAARAPAYVGRNRAAAAALALGATHLILDDGLQNPDLEKDVTFLVIDGGVGFGNGRVIPAGPLREPVVAAAMRCTAAIIIGEDATGAARALPPSLPILRGNLFPNGLNLSGRSVVGFAGIGRPEKFRASLVAAGAIVTDFISFPDHHPYSNSDIAGLRRQAETAAAVLVTTEKDLIRLAPADRPGILALGVALVFDPAHALAFLLAEVMKASSFSATSALGNSETR